MKIVIAASLLTEKKVFIKGLYSEKKGSQNDAFVELYDTGSYVNYKLSFPEPCSQKRARGKAVDTKRKRMEKE